jgi:nucleotide-binding universal stress UspA family protein
LSYVRAIAPGVSGAAVNSQKPYVIVVGVDYSDDAELALRQSIEMAASRNAELHAIHVISEIPPPLPLECAIPPGLWSISVGETASRLEQYIARKVESLRESGAIGAGQLRVVVHVRLMVPAREIAELAADLEADLVVLGTHGRRGLPRLVLGSVAEEVVRLAPCPVLVVRPKRMIATSSIRAAVP